jgi:hypothetical protein
MRYRFNVAPVQAARVTTKVVCFHALRKRTTLVHQRPGDLSRRARSPVISDRDGIASRVGLDGWPAFVVEPDPYVIQVAAKNVSPNRHAAFIRTWLAPWSGRITIFWHSDLLFFGSYTTLKA